MLADSVSLLIQSLPFPDGVSILSPTKSYVGPTSLAIRLTESS